jgi:hypothetical protein
MNQEEVMAAVARAVRAKVANYESNRTEEYFGQFSDDITIMFEPGRWTRSDYEALWTRLVGDGDVKVVSSAIEDLKIQPLPGGQAAVATYFMPTSYASPKGRLPEGLPPHVRYRQCEVWADLGGDWKLVHMTWISGASAAA